MQQQLVDYKPPLTRAAKRREEVLLADDLIEGGGLGTEENQEEIRELPGREVAPLAVVRPVPKGFDSVVLYIGV